MTNDVVVERLDVVIRLLASMIAPTDGVNERARRLRATGMTTESIAAVLGTTAATVRAAGNKVRRTKRGVKRA